MQRSHRKRHYIAKRRTGSNIQHRGKKGSKKKYEKDSHGKTQTTSNVSEDSPSGLDVSASSFSTSAAAAPTSQEHNLNSYCYGKNKLLKKKVRT